MELRRNFETYRPQDYRGATCADCGRTLDVVHDHDESDWPYRFACKACEERARRAREAHAEPVRRFERDGMMLRWSIQNRGDMGSWLRLVGLAMQYIGTPTEYAVTEARWKA